MIQSPDLPDVYSTRDIARAAGVRPRDVQDLVGAGLLKPIAGRFFTVEDAIFAVRSLAGFGESGERALFRPASGVRREPGLPLALAGTLHVALVAALVLTASLGMAKPAGVRLQDRPEMRLVFLVAPGPGGGGGGGGHQDPLPAPPAERQGTAMLRSPVVVRRPPPRVEPPRIVRHAEPPPVKAEPAAVVAPVVSVAADPRDRASIPWSANQPPESDSHGPGRDGGMGNGQGIGLGDGLGSGLGPGSGGGTGGGPYRPGTGITAPAIVHEVKPDYTEEGRRRNLEGDVVLEVVVRSDGTVGDVKLLQGLGAGLDQRAAEAMRQWRFSPARRFGTPVDVVVEVAMEFKLR